MFMPFCAYSLRPLVNSKIEPSICRVNHMEDAIFRYLGLKSCIRTNSSRNQTLLIHPSTSTPSLLEMDYRISSRRESIHQPLVYITDIGIVRMTSSYYDQACTSISYGPVLGVKACAKMQAEVKRCDSWLQRVCRERCVTDLPLCTPEPLY